MIEGFMPDENQYILCGDINSKGETNYIRDKNEIKKPQKGFYSSIIKITNEKNNPRMFKSPKCIKPMKMRNNYFNDNNVIDISKNNWEPPIDPHVNYGKPDDDNSLLYPDDYLDEFVDQHKRKNQPEILNRNNYFSNR